MTLTPGYEPPAHRTRMMRGERARMGRVHNGYDATQGDRIEEDPTGLLNEGFRYRDLETGSFITRDPAGFIDGPNLYTYVNDNPWTHFDPEGLASDDNKNFFQKAWDTVGHFFSGTLGQKTKPESSAKSNNEAKTAHVESNAPKSDSSTPQNYDWTRKPDTKSTWVHQAESQLGIKRINGENTPAIQSYFNYTTYDLPTGGQTSWCSAFANATVAWAGYQGSLSARAKDWLGWGQKVDHPVYGAITIFERGHGMGHVAFTVGQTKTGELVELGGNQGKGEVKYSLRDWQNKNKPLDKPIGYRMPANMDPKSFESLPVQH